jgi:hypothetical protein
MHWNNPIVMKRQFTNQVTVLTDHPLISVFVVALLARLALAAVVAIWFDSTLFLDDQGYITLATEHARGYPSQFTPDSLAFWNTNLSFLAPIAFLFGIFGPVPFLAQSMSAIAGAVAAVCVAKLLLRHTGPIPALAAGLLIALYPSQVLWSSLVLKDALVWMALAVLAVLTAWWHKQTAWKGIALGIVGQAAVLVYISHLRVHTLIVGCIALIIVAAWKSVTYRAIRVSTLFLLLLIVPLRAGSGPAGQEVTQVGISGMAEQRQAGAANASTAVVTPPLGETVVQLLEDFDDLVENLSDFSGIASGGDPISPEEGGDPISPEEGGDRISPEEATVIISRGTTVLVLAHQELYELEAEAFNDGFFDKSLQPRLTAILSNLSEVHTPLSRLALHGSTHTSTAQTVDLVAEVQLAQDRLTNLSVYLNKKTPSTLIDDVLYLPKAIRVMLLDPLPHHFTRSPNLLIALLEHLLWYPILILAAIGIYSNRNTLFRLNTGSPELLFALLLTCGLTVMWGLVEGNFGTAFRHRGEFVWAVITLAGLGFAHVRHVKTHGVTNRVPVSATTTDGGQSNCP